MSVKEYISQFHNEGLYLPSRTITITGDIDIDMYDNVIKNLHILDNSSGTIHIKLNSDGGCVIQGRAIYDAILSCKNHVRIIVYGGAASAASFILQAADERVMVPNSYLMLHIGSGQSADSEAHPENKDRWDKFDKGLEKWMKDIYYHKIKEKKKRYTKEKLKQLLVWDTIMSPKEALDLGLIDLIGDTQ